MKSGLHFQIGDGMLPIQTVAMRCHSNCKEYTQAGR